MCSYVVRSMSTPCWWMPDSWANALAPTIALLGWIGYPVSRLTSREVRAISRVLTSVLAPREDWWVRRAITTSSMEQLPARSPMPLTATSTWRGPACRAAIELATDTPRSSWQWTLQTAWSDPGTSAISQDTSSEN